MFLSKAEVIFFFLIWQESNFETESQIFCEQNQYYLFKAEPTCRSG